MNVFYCDKDPVAAAQSLCDKHVVKMCLETAQILSTVAREISVGGDLDGLYKPTHTKHPVVQTAATYDEYRDWIYDHGVALGDEYRRRFDRVHASTGVILVAGIVCACPTARRPVEALDAPQCMPPRYCGPDPVKAYREYLASKYLIWKTAGHPPRWTRRIPPAWLNDFFDVRSY